MVLKPTAACNGTRLFCCINTEKNFSDAIQRNAERSDVTLAMKLLVSVDVHATPSIERQIDLSIVVVMQLTGRNDNQFVWLEKLLLVKRL